MKITMGYSESNTPLPSNLDLNEFNQFMHVLIRLTLSRFLFVCLVSLRPCQQLGYIAEGFIKEIAGERMELKVGKNKDGCLVISENESRQQFLNGNTKDRMD